MQKKNCLLDKRTRANALVFFILNNLGVNEMNNLEFVNKAKEIYEKYATTYSWGSFMNKSKNGKLCTDCSGFIKGILWGYPTKGKYASNGVPDINADTMFNRCSDVSTNFNNIEIGEVVWVKGHIGIYIGNCEVLESTSKWSSKLQKTSLLNQKAIKGLNGRCWTKHGKLPYLTYNKNDAKVYVVKKGDNLTKIAKQYKVTVDELVALNNIENKNLIQVGQKLILK